MLLDATTTLVVTARAYVVHLSFFLLIKLFSLSLPQSNKPIMEKRRRARINNCLNELKALILDATKKDVSVCTTYESTHQTLDKHIQCTQN